MLNPTCSLVFTAVTDPISAKLVKSLDHPSKGVTGISDALTIESQIDLIQKIAPQVKTIGIIYNVGEINSVKMVTALKERLKSIGIAVCEAAISKSSEATMAVQSLAGQVQALYVPNDNTAVAAMKSIALLAEKYQLPLFASDIGSVQTGALAACAYDRRDLGYKAGLQVISLLQGKSPHGVTSNHQIKTFINLATAKK